MAKKQFKAESKRLLDLMINSIYTHKEIFLRELISNASDAIDKLYYRSLTDDSVKISKDTLEIILNVDKIIRTLTISDNGCGMTKDELEGNLGTIAKSGSLEFKNDNEKKEDIDIIGQFGVGFYSAFMVAKKVTVISRAYGSDEAYKWESDGADGYTITPCEKQTNGTIIILEIKDDTDDEKYESYLETYEITRLVQRYSDYIRYPIKMAVEKSRKKEGSEDEWEDYTTIETLNSMIPIWKKSKSEVTSEDYNAFYKDKYMDYEPPLKVIHAQAEGVTSYTALMFIPSKAPYGYYSKDFDKGLALYTNGVLIMDKCEELLPDCFGFVRGLVDSQSLSLNISREMLQHDRQLKVIAGHLEKKIKNELATILKNDREKYEQFYKQFGLSLKYGIYTSYGANRELLQDLLMFVSSNEKKLVTLKEYTDRMKEDQKYIYYACGCSVDAVAALPQTEAIIDKGYEILYFTDEIDEFSIKMLANYADKQFKSISDSDIDIASEDDKKLTEQKAEENKDMFEFIKQSLGDKVADVKPSTKLKTHPVCLSTKGAVSLEMEKVLNSMPSDQKVKAETVLEINTEHDIFKTLTQLFKDDNKDLLKTYANVLYNQALLIEGMKIENPVDFSNDLCKIMSK